MHILYCPFGFQPRTKTSATAAATTLEQQRVDLVLLRKQAQQYCRCNSSVITKNV